MPTLGWKPEGPWPSAVVASGGPCAILAPNMAAPAKPSSLVDTRVVCCGDNLEQLRKLPDACVDLIYAGTALQERHPPGRSQM